MATPEMQMDGVSSVPSTGDYPEPPFFEVSLLKLSVMTLCTKPLFNLLVFPQLEAHQISGKY
jgi:hypothetical protein